MPTAGPLQANIIGFKNLYIRKVRMPPESRLKSSSLTAKLSKDGLNVSLPLLKSAPAQNALPAPEIITAFRLSSAYITSNALINSSIMRNVKAFNLSGLFNNRTAISSCCSIVIVLKVTEI